MPDFELLGGQLGKLQRHRCERDEAVRVGRAHLRQLLILQVDQLGRQILVGRIPERVDADGLDVDAHLVHLLNPCGSQSGVIVTAERDSGAETPLNFRALEQLGRFRHAHMAVNVHGFHAALPYHDWFVLCANCSLRRASRRHRSADIAADKNNTRGRAHNALYEIPAIRHFFLLLCGLLTAGSLSADTRDVDNKFADSQLPCRRSDLQVGQSAAREVGL